MNTLWIHDGGFCTDEIERGISAARRVFVRHGVSPMAAHAAMLATAQHDNLPSGIYALAAVWKIAEHSAISAAARDWHRIPESAVLVLE